MLKALILCGGDKIVNCSESNLNDYKGSSPVDFIYESLLKLKLDPYLSINSAQAELFSGRFPAEKLITDEFDLVKGPVSGLVSAHKYYPQVDWLVLSAKVNPCINAVSALLSSYEKRNCEGDFYILEERIHSSELFPCIFKGDILKWIYSFYLIGKIDSNEIWDLFKHGKKVGVNLSENEFMV